MKTILVTVGDGSATPLLATALLAAKRFGSRITGLNALTTEYAVVFGGEMGFSVSAEVDRTLEREGQDRREQARTLFTSFMEKQGVPMGGGPMGGGPPESGPSAEWREESGRQNAVVGLIGRVFDLIAVERPAKLASLAEATLEDALFESGRPVLMAPATAPTSLGERIMVAWNGSVETARTVALAMPFLERASSLQVVSVEGGMTPGPSAEDLACALSRHGIPALARHVTSHGKTPGELYLEEATSMGADLLVKGAYTQ
ncbi:MAG TPA: universal stress protein, partial [Stellaceae bacterium]|nr:universal stress protein [Stellaceae bacterium]